MYLKNWDLVKISDKEQNNNFFSTTFKIHLRFARKATKSLVFRELVGTQQYQKIFGWYGIRKRLKTAK